MKPLSRSKRPVAFGFAVIDNALTDGGRDARLVLRALLKSRTAEVRHEAAEAIGELGDNDSVMALADLVEDRNWMVRLCAAQALGEVRTRSAVPALLRFLEDGNGLVRGTAARSLSQLRYGYDVLRKIAPTERDPNARLRMLVAMRRLSSRTSLEPILQLLRARDYRVRIAVVNLLLNDGPPIKLSSAERRTLSDALEKRLAIDKESSVRSALERGLATLRAS